MTATDRRLYNREKGDQFVALRNLGPADKGRAFEVRDTAGHGRVGLLDDVVSYPLTGHIVVRFAGENQGIIGMPDDEILRKPRGYEPPTVG